eukprot:14669213-Ditylum_brightwellii.AAC.1
MEVLFDIPLWIVDSAETVDDTPVLLVGKQLNSSEERLIDACFCGYQLVGLSDGDIMVMRTTVFTMHGGGKSESAFHLLCAPSTQNNCPGMGREPV